MKIDRRKFIATTAAMIGGIPFILLYSMPIILQRVFHMIMVILTG
jgi:hypothetical protein